jgi:hypothetical protein
MIPYLDIRNLESGHVLHLEYPTSSRSSRCMIPYLDIRNLDFLASRRSSLALFKSFRWWNTSKAASVMLLFFRRDDLPRELLQS